MLVFSIFLLPKVIASYILYSTFTSRKLQKNPITSLHILPENLGSFYNSIHVYMLFWNAFPSFLQPPKIKSKYSTTSSKKRHQTSSSRPLYIYFFTLLYFILNVSAVAAFYNNILPISSLSIMPTLLGTTFLYQYNPTSHFSYKKQQDYHHLSDILESSPNSSKLSYLCAWQSLHKENHRLMNFNPGRQPICIDSGATCSISNNKNDFIDFTPTSNTVLHGISSGLNIVGKGSLRWPITNDNGNVIDLHTHDCLYVSTAPMCLLSLQQLMQQTSKPRDIFTIQHHSGQLIFDDHIKTIYYNKNNNLPIFFTASNLATTLCLPTDLSSSTTAFLSSEELPTIENCNLTSSQRKLLHRHHQLAHLHMTCIRALAKEGIFGPNSKDITDYDIPLCKACIHGKQHHRPISSASTGPLDASHLQPGDCISCDQLESTSPGLIPTLKVPLQPLPITLEPFLSITPVGIYFLCLIFPRVPLKPFRLNKAMNSMFPDSTASLKNTIQIMVSLAVNLLEKLVSLNVNI
jgi:hypothetical protein